MNKLALPTAIAAILISIGSFYCTQRHVNKYGESPYEKHVYFPDSGRLWNINSKTTQPSYIRNIRGNYKRFYFGSLNSK